MEIKFQPIGVVHSPLTNKQGAPIQGRLAPDVQGRLEVFAEFEEGLVDIEGFSHLILIYHFNRSEGYKLLVRPFLDEQEHGVFAVRAPRRPNQIGFSVVRLLRREGRILHLAELDILDQTPVLDIKPFVPAFDHRENVEIGWLKDQVKNEAVNPWSDDRFN